VRSVTVFGREDHPLNEAQALSALEEFVRYYVKTFGFEDAGRMLLSDIDRSSTPDGLTADPAAWEEWVRFCDEASRPR
jgi:hypothetical protein